MAKDAGFRPRAEAWVSSDLAEPAPDVEDSRAAHCEGFSARRAEPKRAAVSSGAVP